MALGDLKNIRSHKFEINTLYLNEVLKLVYALNQLISDIVKLAKKTGARHGT